MKTVTRSLLALVLLHATSACARDTYVKPYVRKGRTYVNGYMRTAPNNTVNDNYSTQGNVNPCERVAALARSAKREITKGGRTIVPTEGD